MKKVQTIPLITIFKGYEIDEVLDADDEGYDHGKPILKQGVDVNFEWENNALERLTPQRKLLVEHVLKNLEEGTGIWKKGWRVSGVPESATTGKKYRGINNFYIQTSAYYESYTLYPPLYGDDIQPDGWFTSNSQYLAYHFLILSKVKKYRIISL